MGPDPQSYPFLTTDQFTHICKTFVDACEDLAVRNANAWVSVDFLTRRGSDYIRIVRHVKRTAGGSRISAASMGRCRLELQTSRAADEDDEFEEFLDEERLPFSPAIAHGDADGQTEHLKVTYDILLSPSYRVPILHFGIQDPKGQPLTDVAAVHDLLVPILSKTQVLAVGSLGGISLLDHPITGSPSFFIHPCNTADAMRLVAGSHTVKPSEYLLLWMGIITSCVGLSPPVPVATVLCQQA